MGTLVQVFDEDTYIGVAFLEGIKYVNGTYGWFTTLDLLLLIGERLEGWKYSVYPIPLMITYEERE